MAAAPPEAHPPPRGAPAAARRSRDTGLRPCRHRAQRPAARLGRGGDGAHAASTAPPVRLNPRADLRPRAVGARA
eukprot:1575309-Prymnesium_polylepis.1